MSFKLNDKSAGRIIAITISAALGVTAAIGTEVMSLKENAADIYNDTAIIEGSKEDDVTTIVIPFDDSQEDDSSSTLKSVYNEIVEEALNSVTSATTATTTAAETTTATSAATTTTEVEDEDENCSTTESNQSDETDVISVTTTTAVSSADNETTSTTSETITTNGKSAFNYDDVSSIASELATLSDFVDAVRPTSFSWNASNYASDGCIEISLVSSSGIVTLNVKPVVEFDGATYTIDGEVSGSKSASSIENLEWYEQNKTSGCSIRSVTWLKDDFGISTVRGIGIGSSIGDVTEGYLCVNGGATRLYKASDVITNSTRLNSLLAVESAYTFVGGRIYSMSSYLETYYSGKSGSYRFASCDYVVQYGCNSVMDSSYAANDTTGSWVIEYAIKNDAVVGITFVNRSTAVSISSADETSTSVVQSTTAADTTSSDATTSTGSDAEEITAESETQTTDSQTTDTDTTDTQTTGTQTTEETKSLFEQYFN